MKRFITVILTFTTTFLFCLAQNKPELVDEFEQVKNDELMARVDNLWNQLLNNNSNGFVILSGTSLQKHINQRRIEGCNYWRKYPRNSLKYIFENDSNLKLQFWSVPKLIDDPRFQERPLTYELNDLDKPVELSTSTATDEYCPRVFDLEWYSHFMVSNPRFTGKVVIDTSKQNFSVRVSKYRRKLAILGVKPSRIRFFRRHFYHERDEQWWLIPPKTR